MPQAHQRGQAGRQAGREGVINKGGGEEEREEKRTEQDAQSYFPSLPQSRRRRDWGREGCFAFSMSLRARTIGNLTA